MENTVYSGSVPGNNLSQSTRTNCTVSVDLGLDIPDRPLPPEISSILYVACTRVPRLHDLFVSPIYPGMWDKIMLASGGYEVKKVESKLKSASLEFASNKGMLTEMEEEMDWQPDNTAPGEEIENLESQPISVRNVPVPAVTTDADFTVQFENGGSGHCFKMCLRPVSRERHIGIDQGRKNFAIVAVDKEIARRPVVVAAENFNLNLSSRFSAADVVVKLQRETKLKNWMQQTVDRTLPVVDRVIVHLEQMSCHNAHWRQFGSDLGRLIQQSVDDTTSCVVKMSQPHLLRAGGVIHHLGEKIVTELKLVPFSYGVKRRMTQVPSTPTLSELDDPQEGTSRQTLTKRPRNRPVKVRDNTDNEQRYQQPDGQDMNATISDMECRYNSSFLR